MLFRPSGKGRKRQKKGEEGRFRPISRTGGQTPLKPLNHLRHSKMRWFARIGNSSDSGVGLTRYKNRGVNCEWFARIDSRESRCESPVPLSSANSDLPLPHGLTSSETTVWEHGLNPPLSTVNPMHKGFSASGAPLFGFVLADPAPKGCG